MDMQDSRDCASELLNRLMAEGYSQDEYNQFNGARLRRIDCDDGQVVMPYLDRSYMFADAGNNFVMHQSGEHDASGTDGVARIEPENSWICNSCEEGMSDNDEQNTVYTRYRDGGGRNAQTWCNHCTENHAFYCHGTQETFSDDVGSTTADGETVCQDWADDNCVWSDYSEEYYSNASAVEMANGDHWTDTEFAEHGFTCAIDGGNYPNDERHPDHPEIRRDTSDEDIETWMNGKVDDPTQLEASL